MRLLALFAISALAATDALLVNFHRDGFDDAIMADIDQLVGYECREFVSPGVLLMLLDDERLAALVDAYNVSVDTPPTEQRCSTRMADYGTLGEFDDDRVLERAFLDTYAIENLTSSTPLDLPTHGSLRVRWHDGALANVTLQYAIWCELLDNVTASLCEDCSIRQIVDGVSIIDNVSTAAFESLAGSLLDEIQAIAYIEPVFVEQAINLWSTSSIQLDRAISHVSTSAADACTNCRPLWSAGIKGQGQLLGVTDTGVATGACHFHDSLTVPTTASSASIPADTGHRKVRASWSGVAGDFADANGHGTHVCGSALGSAETGSDNNLLLDAHDFDGVAPSARLVFVDASTGTSSSLFIPSPYDTALFPFIYSAGARVHSASWGIADWVYSDEDRRVDLYSWNHRNFLAVFAAGNSGLSRGAASILSPALAKNALAVGASMNGFAANDIASGNTPAYPADTYAFDWVADFSSRGGATMQVPWLKPDLLAAGGRYIWSASASSPTSCANVGSTVAGLAGTSMATPQVAAAALLIRQYLLAGHYFSSVFEPKASLLRAMLTASGEPTRGLYPAIPMASLPLSTTYAPYGKRSLEGHGRVTVASVLPTDGSTAIGILSNENTALTSIGQVRRYCVDFSPDGATDVAVSLAFTDYPSSLAGSPALVNDLDLRVYVDGSSTPLYPNGLTSADHGSTIEVVRTSATSSLRVEISCSKLGFSSQDFSLVVLVKDADRTLTVNGILPGNPASIVPWTTSASCTSSPTTASPTPLPTTAPTPSPTSSPTSSPTPLPTASPTSPPTPVPVVTPAPTAAAVCRLPLDAVLRQVTDTTARLCCRTHADIAQHYIDGVALADPVFEELLRQIVAASENSRRGVVFSGPEQSQLVAALNFADANCGQLGFSWSLLQQAFLLIQQLSAINTNGCGVTPSPAPSTCVDASATADSVYCSGAGEYNFATGSCDCTAERQPNSLFCADLHCSGHGASTSNEQGEPRCECFLGWSGEACLECADASTGLEAICVGVDIERRPAALAGMTHYLEYVTPNEVPFRLSGSFYDQSVQKADDQIPGSGALDCWCSVLPTRVDAFSSHADAVDSALAFLVSRERLRVVAAPAVAGPAVVTSAPPTTSPPTPAPTHHHRHRNSATRLSKTISVLPPAILAFFTLF
jgi:hypothetical protein